MILYKRVIPLIILIFSICFISLMTFYLFINQPANYLSLFSKTNITIPQGTSFSGILNILEDNDLIVSRKQFYLISRYTKKVNKLQAGSFSIPGGVNYFELINILSHAQMNQIKLTIPEGMEMSEIADLFQEKLNIPADEFISYQYKHKDFGLNDASIKSLEGYLYPDTYYFYENISAKDVIRKMVNEFKRRVNSEILSAVDSVGITLNELITMASIIQGEVIYDSEMPVVSAVYWNRIKKGYRLQADPTIQYIIPGPDIRLRFRHLEIESPYNTYQHYGLPPAPINNPGIKAIRSALNPSDDSYLYFVARGDGYHTFTRSLKEHNIEKQKFQQVRWKVHRAKKKAAKN